ncbi:TetR/AcrR family transcriptional regulator [Novosphingobium resinovorum]|nr:TetR/AcrR family transcriptional regulator [Novosphingobium resinovorum]
MTDRSITPISHSMARPREFDQDKALSAAMAVFREYGFEGTSAGMLVEAMGIGRQSLYNTFGDKWQLYQMALRRYATDETGEHIAMLQSKPRAFDGIVSMVDRVVANARDACLGVGSICEFGRSRPELVAIRDTADRAMRTVLTATIARAQAEGDVALDLAADIIASFIVMSFSGLRIAARAGASDEDLRTLGDLALRALR